MSGMLRADLSGTALAAISATASTFSDALCRNWSAQLACAHAGYNCQNCKLDSTQNIATPERSA
jgi:hypothetical protein